MRLRSGTGQNYLQEEKQTGVVPIHKVVISTIEKDPFDKKRVFMDMYP
jgi:hypothetical protein